MDGLSTGEVRTLLASAAPQLQPLNSSKAVAVANPDFFTGQPAIVDMGSGAVVTLPARVGTPNYFYFSLVQGSSALFAFNGWPGTAPPGPQKLLGVNADGHGLRGPGRAGTASGQFA